MSRSADSRVDILLALKTQIEGKESSLAFLRDLRGLLAAVAASAPVFAIKQAGEFAGQIKNLAAQSGISTDAFQVLRLEFARNGVQAETLSQTLITLRRNLQEAQVKPKHALNGSLRDLGLSAIGLQALAPEQQLEAIGRALRSAADANVAFNAALDLLGTRHAPKVIESLKQLAEQGLPQVTQRNKSRVLSEDEIDRLDKAKSRLEDIWDRASIAGAQAVNFALKLQELTAGFGLNTYGTITVAAGLERQLANEAAGLPGPPSASAARDAAAAEQQAAMAAAERAAAEERLAVSLRKSREAERARELSLQAKIMADLTRAMLAQEDALERQVEVLLDLGDPLRRHRMQLEQLNQLEREGRLTAEEAAAARAKLQAILAPPDGGDARLGLLAGLRTGVETNPFALLGARNAALLQILQAENTELDRQIALLTAKAELSIDEQQRLAELASRRAANDNDPLSFTPGQTITAGLTEYANSFGTTAEQISRILTGTIGTSVNGISQGITGWIMGTSTWGDMLRNLGSSVLSTVIQGLVQLGTQQLLNAALGRTLAAANAASAVGLMAGTATALSGLMITPATLATIATMGGATAMAPAHIATALVASKPLALFQEGGYTGDGMLDAVAGIVHRGEYVFDAASTARLGRENLDALRFAAPAGGGGAAAGAGAGASPPRVYLLMDRAQFARAMQEDSEAWFEDMSARHARRNGYA